jgi:uncharacterized protein
VNIIKLHKEADAEDAIAQSVLGICYLDGIGVEVSHQEAFRLLSSAAGRGVPRATTNLARMYAEGLGTAKNLSEALGLYEAAASAGEFLAQIELGRMYSRGIGTTVDREKALRWYEAAVAQEDAVSDCEELHEAKAFIKGGRR